MTMQAAEAKLPVIHFLVKQVHLCFEIQYIVKVLQLVDIKPIPDSPPYCVGLINMADRSIPIIDLALRLGLPRTESYSLSTPIILCRDDNNDVGIIVDEILGLATTNKNAMQIHPGFTDPESLFRGVITIDGKLALVLNMQQILSIGMKSDNSSSPCDLSSMNLTGFKYE